jgi:hypothetical protein
VGASATWSRVSLMQTSSLVVRVIASTGTKEFFDTEETALFDEQVAGLAFAVVDEYVVHLADVLAILVRHFPAHVDHGFAGGATPEQRRTG